MPIWTTTKTITINYGLEYEEDKRSFFTSKHKGHSFLLTTPHEGMEKAMSKVIADLNIKGFRVVTLTPHTTSFGFYNAVYWEGNGGYGYGLGLSHITGMTIFASRDEEISDEEFQCRTNKARLLELIERRPLLEEAVQQLQEAVEADSHTDTTITEKKKLLGGTDYIFRSLYFTTREEALEKQQYLLSQFAERAEQLAAAETALKMAKDQQALLERQLSEKG